MPKKETDLLRDPVSSAQLRYQEQVEAFKTLYIPKRTRKDFNNWAKSNGMRPDILLRGRNDSR